MEAIERLARILERKNVDWEVYWEEGKSISFGIERESWRDHREGSSQE